MRRAEDSRVPALAGRGRPCLERAPLRLFVTVLWLLAAAAASAAIDKRVDIPMVFEYADSALVDSFTTGKSSGWVWIPPASGGEAHLWVGNVPFGFSARARLIVEYDSGQVWPGNAVPCQAWIEADEDPDKPEFFAMYGADVGVKFRPMLVHWPEISQGLDFCFQYDDNGPAPLGTNYLGGIDQVDTLQIPLGMLLKGAARPTVQAVGSLLDSLDDAGVNFCQINLCAEGVLEGLDVTVNVAGHRLRFRNYGQAAATNFTLHVPQNRPDPYSPSHTFPLLPVYHYNFYQTDGLVLSLITPLELWITPAIVERADSMIVGHYRPPSPGLLHDPSYYLKSQANGAVVAKDDLMLSLPIADQPDMPDLAIVDLASTRSPAISTPAAGPMPAKRPRSGSPSPTSAPAPPRPTPTWSTRSRWTGRRRSLPP